MTNVFKTQQNTSAGYLNSRFVQSRKKGHSGATKSEYHEHQSTGSILSKSQNDSKLQSVKAIVHIRNHDMICHPMQNQLK
jgi:hypothetical protein